VCEEETGMRRHEMGVFKAYGLYGKSYGGSFRNTDVIVSVLSPQGYEVVRILHKSFPCNMSR
jgi:hypothetical protein